MALFAKTDTYRIHITDPDDDQKYWVELRPLNAGDQAAFSDTIALTEDQEASVRLGTLRLMMVQRAVVNWDEGFGVSPTAETIRQLQPQVFDQIFQGIGNEDAPLEEKKSSQPKSKPSS